MSKQDLMEEHNSMIITHKNERNASVWRLKDEEILTCAYCGMAESSMYRREDGYEAFCSKDCMASELAIVNFKRVEIENIKAIKLVEITNGREELEQLKESDLESENYDKCPYCHSSNVTKEDIPWEHGENYLTVHCDECNEEYEACITVEFGGADIDSSVKTYKEED